MHVLAFSFDNFEHFLDPYMHKRPPFVIQEYSATYQRDVFRVASPHVIEAAKTHYAVWGEPELPGLELATGLDSRPHPHWQGAIVGDELMATRVHVDSVLSPLSVALLEDAGWYGVNRSAAQALAWGRGVGVGMLARPCWEWGVGPYNCRCACLVVVVHCAVVVCAVVVCAVVLCAVVVCAVVVCAVHVVCVCGCTVDAPLLHLFQSRTTTHMCAC